MHRSPRSWLSAGTVGVLATLALLVFSPRSYAEVKPGDMITPANATKVQDLLSPGVYYKVERGMTMKIVPTERVDWPPPYKDATEKYSGQVRLTDDHRSLVGYVATPSTRPKARSNSRSSTSRSVTTWATTWWAAPKSNRCRSIRTSR